MSGAWKAADAQCSPHHRNDWSDCEQFSLMRTLYPYVSSSAIRSVCTPAQYSAHCSRVAFSVVPGT